VRCNRKATFHYKGKLQVVFRAGLNEIKYDYVDFRQHFHLQYHVAATENRHETILQKTNDLMLYCKLQLSNSKDKVFLPLLLKIYRLYCQKADKI